MPNHTNQKRTRAKESGVALVIAIIALLIVTAVAAGMIIMSNSEVAIDANYRDEQVALFAAKAGLQEARDRMLASNANPIAANLPTVLPGAAGISSLYITSTGTSPWLSTDKYYDMEFMNELGTTSYSGTWYSSSATNTNYSGSSSNALPYRWVRINLKVDRSSYTAGNAYYVDGTSANAAKQVYFDWNTNHECVSGGGACVAANAILKPIYEITSYAVTTNGTHRMLQDEVTAKTFNLNFPSALTLPGPVGTFNAANSAGYCIDGNDGGSDLTSSSKCSYATAPAVSGCTTGASPVPGIGLSTGNDVTGNQTNVNYVDTQISRPNNYTGSTGTTPSVTNVSLPSDMSTPAQLNSTLQTIAQNSNLCIASAQTAASADGCSTATIESPGNPSGYTWSQIASGLPGGSWPNSSTNPQVIYVDGNVDISGNTAGSGILVVTGNLTYDGNSSWNGIIMVVGDGTTTYQSNGGGNGQFNGALFVATTKDSSGNQLSSFGPVDFNVNGGGGNGLYYNSCWINYVQSPITYQLLSSKEISK
jgi:hypothetical protein